MTNSEIVGLAERLEKRAAQDREYAANNETTWNLLKPEFDKFEARTGHNTYAVRMAIDHRMNAKRDAAWADDLEQAAKLLRASTPPPQGV